MIHNPIVQVFLAAMRFKRENDVLRSLLREHGRSNRWIRNKVNATLKIREDEESAQELLVTTCQEVLKFFESRCVHEPEERNLSEKIQ